AGFLIDRSSDGVTFTQIATVGTGVTSYKSTGLTANTTYFYKVQATNSVGTSALSSVASAPPLRGPPPAAPSNLAASAASSSSVSLSWTDNAAGNETGFVINRSTDGVTFSQVGTVGTGIKTYSDIGLAANSKYYYEVAAINAAGTSPFSNVANATTSAAQTVNGPVTSLHYAPNNNFVNGQYVPAQAGFNLADVSSLSDVNSLPAGDKALVWLGMGDGVTSAFTS